MKSAKQADRADAVAEGAAAAAAAVAQSSATTHRTARGHTFDLVGKGKTYRTKMSSDGEKNHTSGCRDTTQTDGTSGTQGGGGRGGAQNRDSRVRPNVVWSTDSKAFAIKRCESRKTK